MKTNYYIQVISNNECYFELNFSTGKSPTNSGFYLSINMSTIMKFSAIQSPMTQ